MRKLRAWPAILLLALIWGLKAIPWVFPEEGGKYFFVFMFGPLVCAVCLLLWWILASRATGKEQLLGFFGVLLIATASLLIADQSVRSFFVVLNYIAPWGITAFAGALVCLAALRSTKRTWMALAAAVVGFGYWDLIRYDGMSGEYVSVLSWRWSQSAEDRFLAELSSRPKTEEAVAALPVEAFAAPAWPGFRGRNRDAIVSGIALDSDWDANPPKQLWKTAVGPGWSSFAVAGDLVFTQEQRGESEAVICLDAEMGKVRWTREYPSRFFESVGGVGPRATPTLADGRLFTLGAEGLLHRLDPLTGEVVWKQDLRIEAERQPPIWGFSSSPLVTNGLVIVHAGGEGENGVLAFDVESGDRRWGAPAGDHSYSSPHLARIAGREAVLMVSNQGVTAVDPIEGGTLWSHTYAMQGYGVLQPLRLNESGLLIGLGQVDGTQRIEVGSQSDKVAAKEVWKSRDMKSDFNDFVAIDGNLYGFDGKIFACVDLETGERRWKGGRYGAGQVLGLPDGGQLLVVSEQGELVLLGANPEQLDELARHRALEGKTWNHPAIAEGRLYVRNGEEAACFELPLKAKEIASRQ